MWFARTSFGWICYTAPMDTLFKKLGGTLSLALLAGLAQAKTLEALRRGPAVPLADFSGELVEAHLACTLPPNGTAAFDLRGVKLVYDAKDATLAINGKKSLWPIEEGRLALRVYLDRTGIEVVSQDGLNLQPAAVVPDSANRRLSATFSEGVTDIDCRAYSLRSIHGAN